MKIENWNGYEIRFVEKGGEWWAVAVDVTRALNIGNTTMALRRIETNNKALISIEGITKGNDLVRGYTYTIEGNLGKTIRVEAS